MEDVMMIPNDLDIENEEYEENEYFDEELLNYEKDRDSQ